MSNTHENTELGSDCHERLVMLCEAYNYLHGTEYTLETWIEDRRKVPSMMAWNEGFELCEARTASALGGLNVSELWGENGLLAATMRCVDAIGEIADLVTTDHETKEAFILRVRSIFGHNVK